MSKLSKYPFSELMAMREYCIKENPRGIEYDEKAWQLAIKIEEELDSRVDFILSDKLLQHEPHQFFTTDWNGEFIKNTSGIKNLDLVLEIGCFEGLTTCYICDNMLSETGRVICVDPLADTFVIDNLDKEGQKINEEAGDMFLGQYDRFRKNTQHKPVELIRKTSNEAWVELGDYRFNMIYVDGDHRKAEVFWDGMNYFQLLKIGGYMLFDDYEWVSAGTKEGIDMCIAELGNKAEVILKNYQVLLKKVK